LAEEWQDPVLQDTPASDCRGFCRSLDQHAAGRSYQALVGIHRDLTSSTTPVIVPMGGFTVRSLRLSLTVRAMPSAHRRQLSSLLSEKYRSVQAIRDTSSVLSELFEMVVLSLRAGVPFFKSFPFEGCLDNHRITESQIKEW